MKATITLMLLMSCMPLIAQHKFENGYKALEVTSIGITAMNVYWVYPTVSESRRPAYVGVTALGEVLNLSIGRKFYKVSKPAGYLYLVLTNAFLGYALTNDFRAAAKIRIRLK